MKGQTRKIDSLGRMVIPKWILKELNLVSGKDAVEVLFDGEQIILKKTGK